MQTESTAEQLKKEFQMTLSKLGHEIRNPIALIVSELQLMASSHPEICTWQGWDSLTDNLDYVRELLNQISDFSHAGTISPIPTNPTDFLRQVLSSEKHTLDYLGITLESHLEEISSPVFIDRILSVIPARPSIIPKAGSPPVSVKMTMESVSPSVIMAAG